MDTAILVHKKHLTTLQSALAAYDQKGAKMNMKSSQKQNEVKGLSLEQGNIQTVPIAFIQSCFLAKNGTPRQPTVCGPSRATLQIRRTVFSNPEHALTGLEQYSHVWIIFLFHKNGHLSHKGKVKPPRMDGQKVGLYSSRSPHRPNALGLTLAKLDKVAGDTLHLSGIDMIDGTPVLDIKPYIPDYDCPLSRRDWHTGECGTDDRPGGTVPSSDEQRDAAIKQAKDNCGDMEQELRIDSDQNAAPSDDDSWAGKGDDQNVQRASADGCFVEGGDLTSMLQVVKSYVSQKDSIQDSVEDGDLVPGCSKVEPCEDEKYSAKVCFSKDSYSTIASWIREPPVNSLVVRFTPYAEADLRAFQPPGQSVCGKPSFRFLSGPEEAMAAIRGVLSADPRSVYRRTCCQDKLFYFSLDTAHITCWFGPDFAEVLRVQPTEPA
ncbi:tRNA (adenine(37)-N6)-methyltransferase isoform X2 [Paramormyrops kingsleyae]|nr:tRNA (adenine(37)-N6)-methyltransferase isoform X2 [Paramormyrops kingsleyae]XP_023655052.1 tRNA (adenine(37)-N6)-methyltransferase isoform X2 [Paramormyrops kingsleyae]